MQENFQATMQVPAAGQPVKSGKSRRGFASMDKSRHKLVSSKGGKAERRPLSNRSESISPTGYSGL